jgi:D-arabinose 1-dehydrogenase-like Zn-dependent alcohol dehydrogenase
MGKIYLGVQVAARSNLRIVQRPIPEPGQGQVLIRVEACGICHGDSLTVEGQFDGQSLASRLEQVKLSPDDEA